MVSRSLPVSALLASLVLACAGCKKGGEVDADADSDADIDEDIVGDADWESGTDASIDGDTEGDGEIEPPPVNGSISEVEGVALLALWGTPEEMGYAYGFLLAEQIAIAVEDIFFAQLDEAEPGLTFEAAAVLMEERMLWPEGYREELDAIVRGVEAAMGALPLIVHRRIEGGNAPLSAMMLALMNASRDLLDVAPDCCSVAAWGEETGDEETRVGGNLQHSWNESHAMQLVTIRQPAEGFTHACSSTVGSLTCQRGMNEAGVVVMPQGAETPEVVIDGRCYSGMHVRMALERIGGGVDMDSEIIELFESHPRCGSTIFLFAQGDPETGDLEGDERAVVIEQDYLNVVPRYESNNSGHGNPVNEALIATNHFMVSETPNLAETERESNRRYRDMRDVLVDRDMGAISDIQAVMRACDERAADAQQSVYFEIGERIMYVAFHTRSDLPLAPYIPPTVLTWEVLTSGIEL